MLVGFEIYINKFLIISLYEAWNFMVMQTKDVYKITGQSVEDICLKI